MAFWAENFQDTDNKDPKRKFRFTVAFTSLKGDQGPVMWYAKTVNKPSFAIANAEHKYLNHTFYYPGSVTWNDVVLTLVDPVDPDMTATLSDIITLSGYTPPTDASSLATMSKAKAASAMGTVTVTQIDGDGNPLETWTLWNAFATEVKYGDLEYGGDDLIELSLTLKYDWARVETFANGSIAGTGGKTFFGVAS